MDSAKTKTKVYLLILSLIMSLMGIAVMRSNPSHGQKAVTPTQQLEGLEKAAPKSPEMDKFLRREKANREANQEAEDMAK